MERIMSQEERIRRAEEIYQRRKSQGVRLTGDSVNLGGKPEFSLFKRLILKIIICVIIYSLFYFAKNSDHLFSRDILNKTNEILAYDMNFGEIYNRINGYLKKFNLEKSINIVNEENSDKTKENMKDDKENSGEEKSNNENAEQNNNVVEGGIGGGNEVEVKDEAEEKQTSQMEIDILKIIII